MTARWTAERANAWGQNQPWRVGCNFIPSTAINQLAMWQEATFDASTIQRELGWAAGLGFNLCRVYLHDLLWDQDPDGFTRRIDTFLEAAQSNGIGTMFVLFDDVWFPEPRLGPQPEPHPGRHPPPRGPPPPATPPGAAQLGMAPEPRVARTSRVPGSAGAASATRALCPGRGLSLRRRPAGGGLGRLQ